MKARLAALIFTVGAVTSAIAALIRLASRSGESLSSSLDVMMSRSDQYVVAFAAAGLVWVALAFAIGRLPAPAGLAGWLMRIVAATVLMGPITQGVWIVLRMALLDIPPPPSSYLENPRSWFGYLATPPNNILALARGFILVGLMVSAQNRGMGSTSGSSRRWSPGPMTGRGPDQVTRILCGHALLAGAAFRRNVLAFFEEKWTATAPEFGLDIQLLANVCSDAEARDKAYRLGFAAIGVASILMTAAIPEFGLPLAIFVAGCVWFVKWRKEETLARLFSQASFNRASAVKSFGGKLSPKLAAALPREDQNLIVYRGFMPFVGAGLDLGGWSFVTFVDKAKVKGAAETVRTFTVPELYAALDAGLKGLQLPSLRCRDYFFVRGLDIKGDPEILGDLANRPRQMISAEMGALYIEEQDTHVRSYKCIQVIDWGGEVIISYYLRCSVQGTSLFVEMKRYLLPPLTDDHRRVDRLRPDRFGLRAGQFAVSLVVGPVVALVSPFVIFASLQEAIAGAFYSDERLAQRRRQAAQDDPTYDYGATTTLRASFAQNTFLHYFQKADADFDNKLIERKILDEIECFLDARGIDTTDIRERQTTILNSGILVQGGDVRAESLAVGQGAQASKVEGQKPARSKETVG